MSRSLINIKSQANKTMAFSRVQEHYKSRDTKVRNLLCALTLGALIIPEKRERILAGAMVIAWIQFTPRTIFYMIEAVREESLWNSSSSVICCLALGLYL